ncbi:MAG: hypothetical protein ACLQUY_25955 [Ktedonobacterales bacterium]
MNREQMSQRLQLWADQAQHEAEEADTTQDMLNWQGKAQVLGSTATFLAGAGANMADVDIWQQIVGDRSRALEGWQKLQEGPEAMLYAGIVAGYDLVMTVLRDMTGRTWSDVNRRTGWVNR